jgi:hypothetical protein
MATSCGRLVRVWSGSWFEVFVVMSAARMLRLYDDDGLGTASRRDDGPQKTVLAGLHQGWIRR